MKFLTDAQTQEPFVGALRWIGWDVETARQHGLENEPHDERIVAHGRSIGRAVISFDLYEGLTRAKVFDELKQNGGKVIVIHGGPGQECDEAVGKLLYHRPKWGSFFATDDGWVEIKDLSTGQTACEMRRAANLRATIQYSEVKQMQGYLKRLQAAKGKPIARAKRPRATPPGQQVVDFGPSDFSATYPGLVNQAK